MYFEIIGPDPAQPKPAGPRRFGVDDLKEPKLIGWIAVAKQLDALVGDLEVILDGDDTDAEAAE